MAENMASIEDSPESEELAAPAPTPPKRGPGHRGQDVRDTMAEMAAKAHEISLEAGSRMAGTMREVIGAAAGLTAFAIESARDLVQYMVRRGQMSQDEADKLMREVEAKHGAAPKAAAPAAAPKAEPAKKAVLASPALHVEPPVVPRPIKAPAPEPKAKPAPEAAKPVAKAAAHVEPPKAPAKPVAKVAAPAKVATPTPAKPHPAVKSAAKPAAAAKPAKAPPPKAPAKTIAKAAAKKVPAGKKK